MELFRGRFLEDNQSGGRSGRLRAFWFCATTTPRLQKLHRIAHPPPFHPPSVRLISPIFVEGRLGIVCAEYSRPDHLRSHSVARHPPERLPQRSRDTTAPGHQKPAPHHPEPNYCGCGC
ncbi:uncharacterized protein BDR25DRAFT_66339 [Lindgomyces ingoldianus]|uniref:Uncharacterized protein n=1 Tax=Lindgomyces ingoldianus TaxID=673940 RepID=A0ACB6RBB5_9PLEO|nr:uncharacterized protein BDR25DRAFT_66339 [Lindgomyces ingoldianus]KAF2476476.1 hypothetical protein BDR25DRAFT_66339 [Lindgomyces ingoldianus]